MRSYFSINCLCPLFLFSFFPFFEYFHFYATLPFYLINSMEGTSYQVRFSLPGGVFLSCDHGLDYLRSIIHQNLVPGMYVCMVITYSRVWINQVRLPILLVVS